VHRPRVGGRQGGTEGVELAAFMQAPVLLDPGDQMEVLGR